MLKEVNAVAANVHAPANQIVASADAVSMPGNAVASIDCDAPRSDTIDACETTMYRLFLFISMQVLPS
jgi:hypothetical protein